jgi:hypothetical protein
MGDVALAAAKQRGVWLGVIGAERAKRHKAEAVARAVELVPVFRDLQQQGLPLRETQGADTTGRRVAPPARGPHPSAH